MKINKKSGKKRSRSGRRQKKVRCSGFLSCGKMTVPLRKCKTCLEVSCILCIRDASCVRCEAEETKKNDVLASLHKENTVKCCKFTCPQDTAPTNKCESCLKVYCLSCRGDPQGKFCGECFRKQDPCPTCTMYAASNTDEGVHLVACRNECGHDSECFGKNVKCTVCMLAMCSKCYDDNPRCYDCIAESRECKCSGCRRAEIACKKGTVLYVQDARCLEMEHARTSTAFSLFCRKYERYIGESEARELAQADRKKERKAGDQCPRNDCPCGGRSCSCEGVGILCYQDRHFEACKRCEVIQCRHTLRNSEIGCAYCYLKHLY